MTYKRYKIIGYGMKKNSTQWEQFNETAIIDCPTEINPYIYIPASWRDLLDHWLVYFEEVK